MESWFYKILILDCNFKLTDFSYFNVSEESVIKSSRFYIYA